MIPHVDISIEAGQWPDEERLFAIASEAVAAAIGVAGLAFVDGSELSILCTDDAGMRAINRQWRGVDKPTNVLSFPGRDVAPGEAGGPMLGDIVLASETIHREAALEGKPFEHHLSHMIVHGLLHLFGYDHMSDEEAGAMEGLERQALAALGMGDPYAD